VKVQFTPTGRKQFLEGIAYMQRENPTAASAFYKRAEKSLRRLLEYPDSGRSIPEFPSLPFREVIVNPYRFFYRVVDETVWIVAAWHDRQIPDKPAQSGG